MLNKYFLTSQNITKQWLVFFNNYFPMSPTKTEYTAWNIPSKIVERFSKNRQEEENTITFRLKCIVIV